MGLEWTFLYFHSTPESVLLSINSRHIGIFTVFKTYHGVHKLNFFFKDDFFDTFAFIGQLVVKREDRGV